MHCRQVLLRWSLQKDVVTIPKSTKPLHVQQNLQALSPMRTRLPVLSTWSSLGLWSGLDSGLLAHMQ